MRSLMLAAFYIRAHTHCISCSRVWSRTRGSRRAAATALGIPYHNLTQPPALLRHLPPLPNFSPLTQRGRVTRKARSCVRDTTHATTTSDHPSRRQRSASYSCGIAAVNPVSRLPKMDGETPTGMESLPHVLLVKVLRCCEEGKRPSALCTTAVWETTLPLHTSTHHTARCYLCVQHVPQKLIDTP